MKPRSLLCAIVSLLSAGYTPFGCSDNVYTHPPAQPAQQSENYSGDAEPYSGRFIGEKDAGRTYAPDTLRADAEHERGEHDAGRGIESFADTGRYAADAGRADTGIEIGDAGNEKDAFADSGWEYDADARPSDAGNEHDIGDSADAAADGGMQEQGDAAADSGMPDAAADGGNQNHNEPAPLYRCTRGEDNSLFMPFRTISQFGNAEAAAIGDVNNDGLPDVAVTGRSRVYVFLQTEDGELAEPVLYETGNGKSVDIGDVTGDGLADIVVSARNAVAVMAQNEAGVLEDAVLYDSNHQSHSNVYKLGIGDFNEDGLEDVASIDWGSQSHDADIFLQGDDGELLEPVSFPAPHAGYDDLEVGDVNGDKRDDVIVMSGQSFLPNLALLIQQEEGLFGNAEQYSPWMEEDRNVPWLAAGVGVGDVTGDNLNDIVTTYGFVNGIAVLPQSEDGFGDAHHYDANPIPKAVEVADVDADGRNDVIVQHDSWLVIGIYLQNEGGRLQQREQLSSPFNQHLNPHSFRVGDINNDGCPDLVLANRASNNVNHDGLVVWYHYAERVERE